MIRARTGDSAREFRWRAEGMSSRSLYLAGWALGLAGILLSLGDDRFALLFLPAGVLIAISAVLNRPPGSLESVRGSDSRRWHPQRIGLMSIGIAWAITALVVGLPALR